MLLEDTGGRETLQGGVMVRPRVALSYSLSAYEALLTEVCIYMSTRGWFIYGVDIGGEDKVVCL